MEVTRQNLIELRDNFLDHKIDKTAIINFAWAAINEDLFEWEKDEIISDTIFEWDNEDINFEINKTNILLWKERLLTEKDNLIIYNNWNAHIETQKKICEQSNSIWKPINKKLKIGVSKNLGKYPINGLRRLAEKGSTGWLIWTGEFSEADNLFQPICAEHLLQQRPEIIKYLGLDVGFRFLSNSKADEYIWYDEKLKNL
ncbi:immunity protein Imm33 domain-containing protein [Flectobacillus roseus]|uniref:immunity protein Imm33 domain-containing protein n=1 Tax=Flectobacillus roseus TaxID=502259 RepID=UPI0024B6C3EF|nr:hypothetical protein [Flectobacillus roseus]MDI9871910.1 hypothetical protein [Flectobacillus roseus]